MLNAGLDSAQRPETREEQLRGRRNLSVDGVLLLEGFEEGPLRELAQPLQQAWVAHGGVATPALQVYRLSHAMTKTDLA